MNQNDLLIHLEGLAFSYPGRSTPIFNNLDLKMEKGDRIGLVAPNGSGKTTLFHTVMGLVKPSSGRITLFGKTVNGEKDFVRVRQKIGLLFQDADDQLFSPTVLEDVAFGPLNLGRTKAEAIAISRKTLKFLGLEGFEDRITFKLSGGEKRLVSLATILSMEPELLLLDEPTTGLDDDTKYRIAEVLCELETSSIIVSHEYDFLAKTTNKLLGIKDGQIISEAEGAVLHSHFHDHVFGEIPHHHNDRGRISQSQVESSKE